MKKLDLIKTAMKEEIECLLEYRIQKMMQEYENRKSDVCVELNKKINSIIGGNEGCVVISFLRSSYITGSNKFKISFYEQEPFVEEEPATFSYSIAPYLIGIEKDISSLWRIIETKYIRVFSWRKEELRRYYMEKIYERSIFIFQDMAENINVKDKKLKIFYGEEMGTIREIVVLGSERR